MGFLLLRRCLLLFFLLGLGGGSVGEVRAQSSAPAVFPSGRPWTVLPEFLFQRGDDPRWAQPDFDDSAWQSIDVREMPSRDGIYWVRFKVSRRNLVPERDGFSISAVASYEFYWDGRLIGRNGIVGADREREWPGYVDNLFQIPPELLGAGEHSVALRLSSFRTGFPGTQYALNFAMGNFRELLVSRVRSALWSVVTVGGTVVVGIVFALLWLLVDRRASLALFSGLCLSAAAVQAIQAWRYLYDYRYDWHYPRLLALTLCVGLMGLLLVAFVGNFLRSPRQGWVLLGALAMMAVGWSLTPIYNGKSALLCACAFSVAFWQSGEAVKRRQRGARLVFAGLAISVLAMFVRNGQFLEKSFFLSFGAALFGCVTALTLQLRDERRAARQAMLTSQRLEIELLKKNIQPHFLMNTLTTIMEVIEQEPKSAVALIEALAGEFHILARVAGEKLIPLGQELELCRAHIRIMSLRRGVACSLDVMGVDENALVPPALFHTLVEGGLTHQRPRAGELRFTLAGDYAPGRARYTFIVHGENPTAATAAPATVPREGTGLRYVKARLSESFADRWSLTAGPVADGWQTMIEIREPETPDRRGAA